MASVTLQHLGKSFTGQDACPIAAVQDLNLEVQSGEFVSIVGPSGCGKTTTLRLIAGLEKPSQGLIRINGRDQAGIDPSDRNLAMVFQNHALYPHMSVRENLEFGLKLRKIPRGEIDSRVQAVVEMLELSPQLSRLPGELSGGECQRVSLGRALIRRPQVLLLDEPLSNLDAPFRARMRMDLRRIHKSLGCTVIHVTHDQGEAMSLGGRVGVMNEGQLCQFVKPEELYRNPANAFVARFIGSPPMNLFHGTIRSMDTSPDLFFVPACLPEPAAASFRFPKDFASKLYVYQNRPILAGFRPEHLIPSESTEQSASVQPPPMDPPVWRFQVEIECVDYLGAEQLLHVHCWGEPAVARVFDPLAAKTIRPGSAWISTGPNNAFLFDAASGKAISVNP